MSYLKWFKNHSEKHKKIIDRLLKNNLTKVEIVEYFKYENLKESEPEFCPLFAKKKKCHNIEYLNCYMCGCPNFRFNDNGFRIENNKTLFSYCSIHSKDGREFISDSAIHQNCSDCTLPHSKEYIIEHFSLHWFKMMKKSYNN